VVISGLSQSGRSDGANAHEHCAYKHLTVSEYVKKEGGRPHAGVSVDQAAARVLGVETPLPSLELGQTANAYPRPVFDRMFRGRKPVAPNWSRRGAEPPRAAETPSAERGVLDMVAR